MTKLNANYANGANDAKKNIREIRLIRAIRVKNDFWRTGAENIKFIHHLRFDHYQKINYDQALLR